MSVSYDSIDVWKLDCLKELLDSFDSAVSKTVAICDIKLDYDLTNVVLFSAGKSIVTLREILTLCYHGYPDGALSLSRNLYEQFIILYFFLSLLVLFVSFLPKLVLAFYFFHHQLYLYLFS